jgi:hypothetical protein
VRRNRGTDIAAACGQLAAGQPVKMSSKSRDDRHDDRDDEAFDDGYDD